MCSRYKGRENLSDSETGVKAHWLRESLMSRNACNGENGETGEKSPAAGDLNWMPKVVPWRLATRNAYFSDKV